MASYSFYYFIPWHARCNVSKIYWLNFTSPSGEEPTENIWNGRVIGWTLCLSDSKQAYQISLYHLSQLVTALPIDARGDAWQIQLLCKVSRLKRLYKYLAYAVFNLCVLHVCSLHHPDHRVEDQIQERDERGGQQGQIPSCGLAAQLWDGRYRFSFHSNQTKAPQYLLFCWDRTSNLGGENSPGVSMMENAAADWWTKARCLVTGEILRRWRLRGPLLWGGHLEVSSKLGWLDLLVGLRLRQVLFPVKPVPLCLCSTVSGRAPPPWLCWTRARTSSSARGCWPDLCSVPTWCPRDSSR